MLTLLHLYLPTYVLELQVQARALSVTTGLHLDMLTDLLVPSGTGPLRKLRLAQVNGALRRSCISDARSSDADV